MKGHIEIRLEQAATFHVVKVSRWRRKATVQVEYTAGGQFFPKRWLSEGESVTVGITANVNDFT